MRKRPRKKPRNSPGGRSIGRAGALVVAAALLAGLTAAAYFSGGPASTPAESTAVASLTPATPAKEYIHAGGRLLATEEPAGESIFADVPLDHPYYDYIRIIRDQGVTLGCGANPPIYCPNNTVTRDQMAVFIMRALGEFNPTPPSTATFSDVPTTHWAFAFIERIAQLGVTLGCGANPPIYCPDNTVTREQMVTFMERANGRPNPPMPSFQRFQDVPLDYFGAFVEAFVVNNQAWEAELMDVIKRDCHPSGNFFCPTRGVTRAEMAALLVIAFNAWQ